MISSKFVKRAFSSWLIAVLATPFLSFANEQLRLPENISQKNLIPGAVRIQVSPRGAMYFEHKLSHLLGNMGISIEDGYFDPLSYEAEKSIRFEDLPETDNQRALAIMVRDMLSKWLVGFSLSDIRPGVKVGESGYIAQFNRFALVTDRNLLKNLGKTDGAILAIELEAKALSLASNYVRVYDLNNRFLGEIGTDNVSIKLDERTPIKIRLPFYVRINEEGQMEFSALKITNNLRDINLQLKYAKLIVPKLAVEINGHRYEFNEAQLANEIEDQMPDILIKLKENLANFAETKIPELLNSKAKEFLNGSMEEVNHMAPPGAGDGPLVTPFVWGMKLEKINQNYTDNLEISLKAFVEDPINPQSRPLNNSASRGAPDFGFVNPETYDIAMSLDRGMINRILQLSFERKYYDQVPTGDGRHLKLTRPPTIDFVNLPSAVLTEDYLKINTKVQVPKGSVTGIDRIALKDNFEVSFDLIGKMRKAQNGQGVEIQLIDIDQDSIVLDETYLTGIGSWMKTRVLNGVKSKLNEISTKWTESETMIPGSMPLPPEILGIKLDIRRLALDPKGHLVMFLVYKQEK